MHDRHRGNDRVAIGQDAALRMYERAHECCAIGRRIIAKRDSAFQVRGRSWIETVAPYLTLDSSYAELPDFEGAKFVMSPPIRSKEHGDFLWQCLADGTVDTVGTDHAPFDFNTQKHMGHPDAEKCVDAQMKPTGKAGNFTLIPNGIPSVEERVKLLFTEGVCRGRIDLQSVDVRDSAYGCPARSAIRALVHAIGGTRVERARRARIDCQSLDCRRVGQTSVDGRPVDPR